MRWSDPSTVRTPTISTGKARDRARLNPCPQKIRTVTLIRCQVATNTGG